MSDFFPLTLLPQLQFFCLRLIDVSGLYLTLMRTRAFVTYAQVFVIVICITNNKSRYLSDECIKTQNKMDTQVANVYITFCSAGQQTEVSSVFFFFC